MDKTKAMAIWQRYQEEFSVEPIKEYEHTTLTFSELTGISQNHARRVLNGKVRTGELTFRVGKGNQKIYRPIDIEEGE